MNFEPDPDDGTLPPGVVSRAAGERMLEVTGTQPTDQNLDRQASLIKHAFIQIAESQENHPRKKWAHSEVARLATAEQWAYGLAHGRLDVGTVCAVGNLLLRGLAPNATRKALGITPRTWNDWYAKGTDQDAEDAPTQSPYNVFAFIVDHSQAVVELRAVDGWAANFGDWKAAQAYLVARNPDEWSPTIKSTIDTTTKAEVTVVKQDVSAMLEVLAILERANALPSRTTKVEVLQVESIDVGTEISDRSECQSTDTGDQ